MKSTGAAGAAARVLVGHGEELSIIMLPTRGRAPSPRFGLAVASRAISGQCHRHSVRPAALYGSRFQRTRLVSLLRRAPRRLRLWRRPGRSCGGPCRAASRSLPCPVSESGSFRSRRARARPYDVEHLDRAVLMVAGSWFGGKVNSPSVTSGPTLRLVEHQPQRRAARRTIGRALRLLRLRRAAGKPNATTRGMAVA